MVLANKAIMGKTEMKNHISISLLTILILSLLGCNNNHLSQKEYNRILDSLRNIHVPVIFDSVSLFKKETENNDANSPDSNGIITFQYRKIDRTFHKSIRHKDSLFEDVFEYDQNGHLEYYYKRYFCSIGDDPVGYVTFYDEQGQVKSFQDGIWLNQKTGNNAAFNIHDVINKLKQDNIDLLRHNVYISYTNASGKKDDKSINDKYYWLVIIDYYHDYNVKNKKIKYQRKLRISPDTGEVLEDWIEEWE